MKTIIFQIRIIKDKGKIIILIIFNKGKIINKYVMLLMRMIWTISQILWNLINFNLMSNVYLIIKILIILMIMAKNLIITC